MIRSDLVRFLDPSSYGPIPVVLTGVVCPAMPGRRRISLDCSQRISKMSQSQYWVGHFLASESRIREDARIVTMEDAMRIRTRKATEIWVRGSVAVLLAGLIPLLQGCSSPTARSSSRPLRSWSRRPEKSRQSRQSSRRSHFRPRPWCRPHLSSQRHSSIPQWVNCSPEARE